MSNYPFPNPPGPINCIVVIDGKEYRVTISPNGDGTFTLTPAAEEPATESTE